MATVFPYLEVPEEALPVVGKPDPGTRVYRQSGSHEECREWVSALFELFDHLVSPGGAAPLAHVSRAAVHKRIKEGKLTAFAFHVKERRLALFGKTKEIRKSPQVYVSVSEAKAWGEELEERAVRLGYISEQDLEGAKPDWHGNFWEWRSKFMRSQYRKHDEEISE